jgi:hypothetical protein
VTLQQCEVSHDRDSFPPSTLGNQDLRMLQNLLMVGPASCWEKIQLKFTYLGCHDLPSIPSSLPDLSQDLFPCFLEISVSSTSTLVTRAY